MLIFSDPTLEPADFENTEKLLSSYKGNGGELVEIKIARNKEGSGALINVMIICFKRLLKLLDVTEEGYNRFIEKHRIEFMKFYRKTVDF